MTLSTSLHKALEIFILSLSGNGRKYAFPWADCFGPSWLRSRTEEAEEESGGQ